MKSCRIERTRIERTVKYFEGAERTSIEDTTLKILEAFLKSGLQARSSTFAPWGGVEVKIYDLLADKALDAHSKRPVVFLFLEEHERGPFSKGERVGNTHFLTFTADCITNDTNLKAERLLREAVQAIVEDGKKQLRLLGLFQAAPTPSSPESQRNRVNPIAITATAFSLK
jgi:hypothetical protein